MFRVAPTSSTARKTNDMSLSGSMVPLVRHDGVSVMVVQLLGGVGSVALDARGAGASVASGDPPGPLPRLGRCWSGASASGRPSRRWSPPRAWARAARSCSPARPGSARARCSRTPRRGRRRRDARAAGGRDRRRAGGAVRRAAPAAAARPRRTSTRIPAPQAEALGSALALRAGRPAASGSRSGAAVLSLLSRGGRGRRRSRCCVDDAHLLDPPSAQALCFAARRLTADPVRRPGRPRRRPGPLAEAGLPELPLAGLDAGAGRSRGRLGCRPCRRRAAASPGRTGGNPLALSPSCRHLTRGRRLAPGAPSRCPPRSPGRSRAARTRSRRPARRSWSHCGAAGGGRPVASAAVRARGRRSALDEAEQARAAHRRPVTTSTFRHDLVRSGIYAEASPATRRAVHAALAQAVPADDVDRRRVAPRARRRQPRRHRRRRARRGCDRVRRPARGARAVAAAGFERAAGLTPGPGRARRGGWLSRRGERRGARARPTRPPGCARTGAAVARQRPPAAGRRARRRVAAADRLAERASRRRARRRRIAAADEDPDAAVCCWRRACKPAFVLADGPPRLRARRRADRAARAAPPPARPLGGHGWPPSPGPLGRAERAPP